MDKQTLVKQWFYKWETGDFTDLPITDNFKHTSPFGTIQGKTEYLALVEANKDKFLGYQFTIHDELYDTNRACVRYTAVQGDFKLEVSEWYFFKNDLIEEIVAYYHIGEIRDDRQLSKLQDDEEIV